jgi:serpin B
MHSSKCTFSYASVIGGLLLVLVSVSVGQTGPPASLADDKGATPAGITAVINANNQFALDLYSELRKSEEGKNVFFSPYSISTALAMTYEAARGKTAEEMQSVFHFPADGQLRKSAFAAIHNQLNKPDSKFKLSIANALWSQKDFRFLSEYMTTVQQYYAAKATNVDFIGATEESRKIINKWVEDKTNDKIKELLREGILTRSTRLVLTNAIYFKGTWSKPFDKSQTKDGDFRVSATNTIKVPMMHPADKNATFNYAATSELQILEMPYEGGRLSMLVLLPTGTDLSLLEESLSLAKINDWRSKLKEQRVNVFMPKFTFDTKYGMHETLAKMGMPTAFDKQRADFSGMTGRPGLYISAVIHQAFVDVNEEGTEAAAATAVVMSGKSVPPPVPIFRADHPFIFVIQDKENGNILFIGRVVNPTPPK